MKLNMENLQRKLMRPKLCPLKRSGKSTIIRQTEPRKTTQIFNIRHERTVSTSNITEILSSVRIL